MSILRRDPKCCACGKELPPRQSLAETFGQAGWNVVSNAPSGSGLDAALYTALVCGQCDSISCYPCAGFRPDTHPEGSNYSVSCPKCGGKVVPLNSDIYRTLLAKAEHTLIDAVRQGDVERTKELIADGVNLTVMNPEGGTALHDAAKSGSVEVTKLLLEHGAEVNARDRIGMTPLYLAAWEGHAEVVTLLLNCGADTDTKDSMLGASPLLRAAVSNHTEVVKVLAEHGANVSLTDSAGETALQLVEKRGYSQIAKVLRAHGAKG